MYRLVIILIVLAAESWGACSMPYCSALAPTGSPATATITSIPPSALLNATSMYVEARVHTAAAWGSSSFKRPVSVAGIRLRLNGSGAGMNITFDFPDATDGYCNGHPWAVGTSIDIQVLIVRDAAGMAYHAKQIDTQTGATTGSCDDVITSLATSNTLIANGVAIGDSSLAAGVDVAYARWCTGTIPITTNIPAATASPCDLGDWKFENNGTDASGNGQTIGTISTYDQTPTYAPVVDPGSRQTFNRNTGTGTLSGSCIPLDGGSTITYAWSYAGVGLDGVTQTPTITTPTTASTGVTGLSLFGSANFKLTCTDSSTVAANATIHDGVVTFNASTGAVNIAADGRTSAQVTIVGGGLSAYGHNTWPYVETDVMNAFATQKRWLADANVYGPFWRTYATGTISFTGGSTTVTGTGTSFLALFCGGVVGPPTNDSQGLPPFLAWHYTGTDGLSRYTMLTVKACASNTALTLIYPDGGSTTFTYPMSPPTPWPTSPSGLNFRRVDFDVPAYYAYANASAAGQYYDSVEFGKRLYWRSGFDDAWDYANTWATYWLEFPGLDGYFNLLDTNHGVVVAAGPTRSLSVEGIVLHEQDGHPELLPGLRGAWAYIRNLLLVSASIAPKITGRLFDLRENAYEQAYLADCALIETGAALTQCRADMVDALDNIWTPLRFASIGGVPGWQVFYADQGPQYSSIPGSSLGGQGTVAATAGMNTLVGTGTAWDATLVGRPIWLWSSTASTIPPTNASGDSQQYIIGSFTDATHITILTNYAGTTGSGKGFATGVSFRFAGWGLQPYMEGILAKALFLSSAASTAAGDTSRAATYASYGHDAIQLVATKTRTPDQGGIYYGFGFAGCTGVMTNTPVLPVALCYGADGSFNLGTGAPMYGYSVYVAEQLREQTFDVMQAICMDMRTVPSVATRSLGDSFMNEIFAKPGSGAPVDDANYLQGFSLPNGFWVAGSWGPTSTGSKFSNQLDGFTGAASCWSAARAVPLSTSALRQGGSRRVGGATR